jgi:hypothetical protein
LTRPSLADTPVALSGDEQEAVADYTSRMTYLTAVSMR